MTTGFAKLIQENEDSLEYTYYGYCTMEKINLRPSKSGEIPFDGYFTIQKTSFEEPEIHKKLKKNKNHKKNLQEKRICHQVNVLEKFKNNSTSILIPCINDYPFRYFNEIYFPYRIAYSLLGKIYYKYQETEEFPKDVAYLDPEGW